MTEIYSSKQRAIIFSAIFVVSFLISLIYLYLRVDYRKTSLIIFMLCVIYTSFFVALNIISMFDLSTGNGEKYIKFSKFISDFYSAFNIVDKVLGFILFNEIIYYLESGHFSKIKKFFDGGFRFINNIIKIGRCKIILIICISIPILGGILTVLIIFRKHFGLESPLDYIGALLDLYSIIEIYISVGFFIIQLFIDYKRRKNPVLIVRYFRYSIIKIVNKVESYIEKIKNAYD